MDELSKQTPGFGTEYVENFCWGREHSEATAQTHEGSGLFNGTSVRFPVGDLRTAPQRMAPLNVEFRSTEYPSIQRETTIRKDERGNYTNPYKDFASKEYGRRLIYDPDHPAKMYGSQWSSELADPNGPYSFHTTTGLAPEVPWTKDMMWRQEGQDAAWPTDQWKQWTQVAKCPPYDGHTDQLEYSKYKVHVP